LLAHLEFMVHLLMQNLKSLTHKEVKKRCALEVNAVVAALCRVLYINAKRQVNSQFCVSKLHAYDIVFLL